MILIHSYIWFRFDPDPPGTYWKGNERDFHDLALYYGLQELSVKAAGWNLMRAGEWGGAYVSCFAFCLFLVCA